MWTEAENSRLRKSCTEEKYKDVNTKILIYLLSFQINVVPEQV